MALLPEWLCTKRLSSGRFHWWPRSEDPCQALSARELMVLLWNGCPETAQLAADWRQVA